MLDTAAATSEPSATGLAQAEAAARLQRDGSNELERRESTPAWRVLLNQFGNPLILLLIGSAAVAAFVGAVVDAGAIAVIVSINALVGFQQEYRVEKAVLALREMTAARARVVRDGRLTDIPAHEVVVGDVLALGTRGRSRGQERARASATSAKRADPRLCFSSESCTYHRPTRYCRPSRCRWIC